MFTQLFDIVMHVVLYAIFPILLILSSIEQWVAFKRFRLGDALMPFWLAFLKSPSSAYALLGFAGYVISSYIVLTLTSPPQGFSRPPPAFVLLLLLFWGVFVASIFFEAFPRIVALKEAAHKNKYWATYVPVGFVGEFKVEKFFLPGFWRVVCQISYVDERTAKEGL